MIKKMINDLLLTFNGLSNAFNRWAKISNSFGKRSNRLPISLTG